MRGEVKCEKMIDEVTVVAHNPIVKITTKTLCECKNEIPNVHRFTIIVKNK